MMGQDPQFKEQHTGRQSCCSDGSQKTGEPPKVQRQSPPSGMASPMEQLRLGLQRSSAEQDPGAW